MKKKINFGGVSTPVGITFFGKKYGCSVNFITKQYSISELTKTNKLDFLSKIPFIRGIYCIFSLLLMLLSNILQWIWKRKLVALGIVSFYLFLAFVVESSPTSSSIFNGVFTVFFWGFLFFFLYATRSNHALEHKVINAYETNNLSSCKKIMKQPKENRRCGGVIVGWYFTLLIILTLANININYPFLASLALFSISFELGLLARKEVIGNFFFAPGYVLQKLTTTDKGITDKKISWTRTAFKHLVRLEDDRKNN